MSKIDDGGPALPRTSNDDDRADYIRSEIGMSLRDFFAAHALAGWLASFGTAEVHPVAINMSDAVAHQAYAMADAMIAERSKGRGA